MTQSRKRKSENKRGVISFATVREIVQDWPGAIEGTSYGTPAFHVNKKLFVRLHQDEKMLVIRIDPKDRAMRVNADPSIYSVTDHYLNYPMVLVQMANINREELQELLEDAWQLGTAKKPGTRARRRTPGNK